jgi:drug/metabolite transporter superfamily protein YnfA
MTNIAYDHVEIVSTNSINTINNERQLDEVNLEKSNTYTAGAIIFSIFLFILAGILEVGGGYLIWQAVREKVNAKLYIPIGCIILIAYGFVPTLQPINSFGRTFAIYGGFFIVLSYAWGAYFDDMKLDAGDYIGSSIAIAGVLVCWFWPRN